VGARELRHHKAVAVAAALAVAVSLCCTSQASAGCGQDYHGAPARSDVAGGPPLAIGDSVLADAVPLLVRDGFEADGMVCRQMSQGLTMLRARGATLPHLVVLALGTNGEVTAEQIDMALSLVGPGRVLSLVVPHGSVVASTPSVIRRAAISHPGRIVLLDWDRLVAGHANWLAPDGVHLGSSAGIAAFAQLLTSVLPYATPASTEAEAPTDPGTPITIQPPPGHRSAGAQQSTASRSRTSSHVSGSVDGSGAARRIPLETLRAFVLAVVGAAFDGW
jgi:hypothetical protein